MHLEVCPTQSDSWTQGLPDGMDTNVCTQASPRNWFPLPITSPSHLTPFNLLFFYISSLSYLGLPSLPAKEKKWHAQGREMAQTWSPWFWGLHEIRSCHLDLGTKTSCAQVQGIVTLASWTVCGKRESTDRSYRLHRGFLASPPDHSTAFPTVWKHLHFTALPI